MPEDKIEVDTPHGRGIVVYITVNSGFQNDIWTVANKADGQLRHYETIQLKMAESGVLGMNEKPKEEFVRMQDGRLYKLKRLSGIIEYLEIKE